MRFLHGARTLRRNRKGDPFKGTRPFTSICLRVFCIAMPRSSRVAPGGLVYHVLNRANGRLPLFETDQDYLAFYRVLERACQRHPLKIYGWCIMPNHWHFVAGPRQEGDLSRFFGYLGLTHATRWQAFRGVVGAGHVYQSRFKNFIIQKDEHLEWVLRYVERNALKANLVQRAQDWPWSSLHVRRHGPDELRRLLQAWPIPMPDDWIDWVNQPLTAAENDAVVLSLRRGRPLGGTRWTQNVLARHPALGTSFRPRGRPPG
jgi:putative transposase